MKTQQIQAINNAVQTLRDDLRSSGRGAPRRSSKSSSRTAHRHFKIPVDRTRPEGRTEILVSPTLISASKANKRLKRNSYGPMSTNSLVSKATRTSQRSPPGIKQK